MMRLWILLQEDVWISVVFRRLRSSCTKPSKIQELQNHSFSETGTGTKGFINFVAPNKIEVKRTEG